MDFINNLTRKQIPLLKEFVKKEYNEKHILLDDEFFEWQFKKNPFNFYPEYAMKVIELNGKIMACNGIDPTPLKVFDKSLTAGIFLNLMVNEKCRGFGLGTQLIKKSSEDFSVCYLTGYNLKTRSIYEKLGNWTHMGVLKRFIKIFNSEKVERLINKKVPPLKKDTEYNDGNLLVIKEFDENINKFWSKIKQKYPITINRSKDFLNWRYSFHPLLNYQIFLYRINSDIKGYIIVRIEECDYQDRHYKIGRIIDFISQDKYEENILKGIITILKKQNVDFMDFLFSGNFPVRSLLNQGFGESAKEPYKNIPILFNPLNWDRHDIPWIVYFKDYGENKNKY